MTFNPFGWLWRLLSCLCGGSRRSKRKQSESLEEERLLRPSDVSSSAAAGVHTTKAAAQAAADQGQAEQLVQAAALPEEYTSNVIVMRHGHRWVIACSTPSSFTGNTIAVHWWYPCHGMFIMHSHFWARSNTQCSVSSANMHAQSFCAPSECRNCLQEDY
jgi:hypothetical protein